VHKFVPYGRLEARANTVFHKYYDYRSRAEPQAFPARRGAEHRAG